MMRFLRMAGAAVLVASLQPRPGRCAIRNRPGAEWCLPCAGAADWHHPDTNRRFNISIMASPRDAASNTQCVWPVSIRFANQAGKQVGPETKFMLKPGESATATSMEPWRSRSISTAERKCGRSASSTARRPAGYHRPPRQPARIASPTDFGLENVRRHRRVSRSVSTRARARRLRRIDQFVLCPSIVRSPTVADRAGKEIAAGRSPDRLKPALQAS